jgi:hypothetical protein
MADNNPTMEGALDEARKSAFEVVSQAGKLVAAGKKAAKAADIGDLKALRQVLANLVDIADQAGEAAVRAAGGWGFATEADEEEYLGDGRYQKELLTAAKDAKVGLFPVEGVLACFPSLVRINAKDRAVAIDRKPFRFVRPSYLVAHLRAVQNKPGRFNPGALLESLHSAYELGLARKKGGKVASLMDLYKILTLLPTVKKDYSHQEFARDLYLLEESGVVETKSGARIRFHAATGTKSPGQLMRIVDRNGKERLYSAVEFEGGA